MLWIKRSWNYLSILNILIKVFTLRLCQRFSMFIVRLLFASRAIFFCSKLKNRKVHTEQRQWQQQLQQKELKLCAIQTTFYTVTHCGWNIYEWLSTNTRPFFVAANHLNTNVYEPKLFRGQKCCTQHCHFTFVHSNECNPHIWGGALVAAIRFRICIQQLVYARTRTMEKMVLLYSVILLYICYSLWNCF